MTTAFNDTIAYIKNIYAEKPAVGIILGSGLGKFSRDIKVEKEISYGAIPHFPESTVEGHDGKLIFGEIEGKKIVAMAGRFHYYEGYHGSEIVFPIRVLALLGIETLMISNAAGGVNPSFKVGDLMVITDHISLFMPNPLIGKNYPEWGPRFPDMSEPYKKALIDKAKSIAAQKNIALKQGVYCGVTGPAYETKAEYKMLHTLGADAVGMSTVPETIIAAHMGIAVFGMSIITDVGIGENGHKITHEEVLEAAREAEPHFAVIIKELIAQL